MIELAKPRSYLSTLLVSQETAKPLDDALKDALNDALGNSMLRATA